MADLFSALATAMMAVSLSYPVIDTGVEPDRGLSAASLAGTDADRDIRMTLLTLSGRRKRLADWADLQLTATLVNAAGTLSRLEGSWEAGTLREVTVPSPGYGLGVGVQGQISLLDLGRLRLDARGGWSFVAFDRPFPAGGTRYNGLIQAGLAARYPIAPGMSIGCGWRLAHLSNGRGVVPGNPGWNGRGWWLSIEQRF